MLRKLLLLGICFVLGLAVAGDAHAAKKKKKPRAPKYTEIVPQDVFSVKVKVVSGKKPKYQSISCLDVVPGKVSTKKGKLIFQSYSSLANQLKKKRGSPAKISEYSRLNSLGKKGCLNPDFLSLDRYKGKFGLEEARILCNRFALGCTADQVSAAVGKMADTVNNLTTFTEEEWLKNSELDFRCNGHRYKDEDGVDQQDAACNPLNRNDLYGDGIRYGFQKVLRFTANPFFYKLMMFLHDERATASVESGQGAYTHTRIEYIEMLRNAAISGDYKQLVRELHQSQLLNFLYLNGIDNRGSAPNENYGRELLELFSIGATSLEGLISNRFTPATANYNDFDIAQMALALSGAAEDCENVEYPDGPDDDTDPDNSWDCSVIYFPLPPGHAAGQKVLFSGTPYQRVVDDYRDVLTAVLEDVRLSESLAYDMWNEFVCKENITPRAVRALAKKIRDNNYMLIPVMKDLMMSKAVYAEKNRGCLIKHPYELLFGFLRQTGAPLRWSRPYTDTDNWLDDMGQRPFNPPTVFGWNEKRLAGEQFILGWRNAVMDIVNANDIVAPDDLDPDKTRAFFRTHFVTGMSSSGQLIDSMANKLNLTLNQAQKAALETYLRNDYYVCSGADKRQCNGANEYYKPVPFEPNPDAVDIDGKIRGLLAILGQLAEYRLK